MKVLAPFSKTKIINLLKINNINMNHFNETSSRPPPEVMPEGPKVRIDPQGRLSGGPESGIDP